MSIALVLATVIFFMLGLVIRSSGSSRVLNVVDYARVDNPAALHLWAGNRLLLLALIAALLATLSMLAPDYSIPLVGVLVLMTLLAVTYLAVGASRFERYGGATGQRKAEGTDPRS